MFGKIILTTNAGQGIEEGFVIHGKNGFLMRAQDSSAWRKTLGDLLGMGWQALRDFERRSFDVAATWTQEAIANKILNRLHGLPNG